MDSPGLILPAVLDTNEEMQKEGKKLRNNNNTHQTRLHNVSGNTLKKLLNGKKNTRIKELPGFEYYLNTEKFKL